MARTYVNWDKHVIHWQNYRKFFNIHVFRYLVIWFSIVPLLAKVLNSIVTFVSNKFHDSALQEGLQLPISWDLLWLSSFFFIAAFLIYLLRCPRFVREFESFSVYQDFGYSPRWLVWLARDLVDSERDAVGKFVERLSEKRYLAEVAQSGDVRETRVNVGELQTELVFNYHGQSYSLAMPILRNSGIDVDATTIAEKEIFWEIFGRYASSKLRSRQAILGFLFLAGMLFSFVLAQNIIAGFRYISG